MLLPKIIVFLGCVLLVGGINYQLTATPDKLRLGEPLTITAQLTNPKIPVGVVRVLYDHGPFERSIFDNQLGACRLIGTKYTNTGKIDLCDQTNHRYKITFPSVTADHIGDYRIEVSTQSPPYSSSVTCQLLVKPTSVVVTPNTLAVVEGQPVTLTCTVDNNATTPVAFEWRRILNGTRANLPTGAMATETGSRQNRLSLTSIGRHDHGEYECRATNDEGSLTSSPVNVTVYRSADDVTLTNSAETTIVGNDATLNCVSTGGNPTPGLEIYDVLEPNKPLAILDQSDQSGSASLTYTTKVMRESDNGTEYQCKTKVEEPHGIQDRRSNIVKMNVQVGTPDTPTDPLITARSHNSLTLQWTKGKSGATKQTFLLDYISNQWHMVEVPDPDNGTTVTYTLENLEPETQYRFRIRSRNDRGKYSKYTSEVSQTTKVNSWSEFDFGITRQNARVFVHWEASDRLMRDYHDSIVTVIASVIDETSGSEITRQTIIPTASFSARKIHFGVNEGHRYSYKIIVRDQGQVLVEHTKVIGASTTNLSLGAVVGIVIGCVAVVALIVVIGAVCVCVYRRTKRNPHSTNGWIDDGSDGNSVHQMPMALTMPQMSTAMTMPQMSTAMTMPQKPKGMKLERESCTFKDGILSYQKDTIKLYFETRPPRGSERPFYLT